MLDLVSEIYSYGTMIYELAQEVQANQEQCQLLADRVQGVVAAVKGVEARITASKDIRYEPVFGALQTCFADCHEFMQNFKGQAWWKRILKSGNNKGQFEDLNARLTRIIPELELGIVTEEMFDRAKDEEAAQNDRVNILSRMDEIKALSEAMLREMQAGFSDLEAVLAKQNRAVDERLARMEAAMTAAAEAKATAPHHHKAKGLINERDMANFFDIYMKEKIGQGSFGAVYRAIFQTQTVAVKMLESMTAVDRHEFVREVKIMSRLRSPHVTQFYAACLEEKRACLLMEYMEQGSLIQFMQARPLRYEQKFDYALQLARGLAYLHSRGVVHADVKPDNVLVNHFGIAKWTDFGLSKVGVRGTSVKTLGAVKETQKVCWQAPETWGVRKAQTRAADVYSFGLVMWFIWMNKLPYSSLGSDMAIMDKVKHKGYREPMPPSMPTALKEHLSACWDPNPEKRPTAEALVRILERVQPPAPVVSVEASLIAATAAMSAGNTVAAREQLNTAASAGSAEAMRSLGLFCLRGDGGEAVSKQKAFDMFYQAATAATPDSGAAYNMAQMLRYGDGVDKDLNGALYWYQKALELNPGDAKAAEKIGLVKAELAAAAVPSAGAGAVSSP